MIRSLRKRLQGAFGSYVRYMKAQEVLAGRCISHSRLVPAIARYMARRDLLLTFEAFQFIPD